MNLGRAGAPSVTLSGTVAGKAGVQRMEYAPGQWTIHVVIPADDRALNNPAGLGYGNRSVNANGLGTLSGKLGDGIASTVAAPLARQGFFPLYAQRYANAGLGLSWLPFTHQSLSDFVGAMNWIKPRPVANSSYPASPHISHAD